MSDKKKEALEAEIRSYVGKPIGPPVTGRDPVNEPMIRQWCDAMGEVHPAYLDADGAGRTVHGEIVAPPTMLQAWTMPGLRGRPAPPPSESGENPMSVLRLLDEAGFTSVVATNCTQEYHRYLKLGDHLSVSAYIESVSDEKKTGLGAGHFVTQAMVYTDQHGEKVATMRFRLLKFRPPQPDADEDG